MFLSQLFTEVTHDIEVRVRPQYLEDRSSAVEARHQFVYFVAICNHSDQPVRLLARHWDISDDSGREFEVDGEGVIGRQPLVAPGDTYEYNSSCAIHAYRGAMKGYYEMERQDGKRIKVMIPEFRLVAYTLN